MSISSVFGVFERVFPTGSFYKAQNHVVLTALSLPPFCAACLELSREFGSGEAGTRFLERAARFLL